MARELAESILSLVEGRTHPESRLVVMASNETWSPSRRAEHPLGLGDTRGLACHWDLESW